MRSGRLGIVTILVAALTAWGLTPPASASVSPDSPAVFQEIAQLPDSLPEDSQVQEFGTGSYVVSVPDERVAEPGAIRPRFSVGVGWTIYIYLNRTDQGAVAAGGAAGLAVLICAVPAVGTAACAGVTAALVAAAYYIAVNGFCPSRMELALGNGVKCVK